MNTDQSANPSQEILRRHQDALKKFIIDDLDEPQASDRRAQIIAAKKAMLYWQGKQYLKIDGSNGLDWSPIDFGQENKRVFAAVHNIIYADGIKFAALISQRKMNQRCVPDDPDDTQMAKAARNAFTMGRYLHRYWRLQRRLANEVAQHLWTTGPVFSFVEWVSDGVKHGYHEEPTIEAQDWQMPGTIVCGNCGSDTNVEGTQNCFGCGADLTVAGTPIPGPLAKVPVEGTPKKYEKGMVELQFLNCLHVQVPFDARSISECGWLDYSQVVTKAKKRAILRQLAVKNTEGSEDSDTAIQAWEALLSIQSPRGSSDRDNEDRIVYSRRWLRPSQYDLIEGAVRKELRESFPDGVQVHSMGGVPFLLEASRLDDYWYVCLPGTGEYINSPGLCSVNMSIQDYWNDFWNMASEMILRAIPKHIVSSEILNADHVLNADNNVGEMLFTRTGGVDLSKAAFTLPTTRVPPDLMAIAGTMRENSRDYGGIQTALFGGGASSPTWREASQRRNQAMMQLQPPFESIQELVTGTTERAVRLGAKYGVGKLMVSPEAYTGFESTEEVDLKELEGDGWHFEAEEGVPQTYGEQVEKLASLATEAPQIAQSVGLYHPINAPRLQTMFGASDLYAPGQFERDRILERIQRLLAEVPLQEIDPMTGQMIEQPSIRPDQFEDKDHATVAEFMRIWCNSSAGRKTKERNPVGYQNVVLHGIAQDQMVMMPPPVPAGPGAPAPEGGGNGAPPPGDMGGVPPVPTLEQAAAPMPV